MDLLKVRRFPYQKRIHNKGNLNLAAEVLTGFSPGVFNKLYVTHNKNLEQRIFGTKERAKNISLFKSNSESYGCQLRQTVDGKHNLFNFLRYLLNLWLSTQTANRKHSVFNF